jgi:hypothetical protein
MEIKGFILWNKDLKRVGYVYSTRESAEIGKFKRVFSESRHSIDVNAELTEDALETLVERAMINMLKFPLEVREVTVTIKETEE